MVWTDVSRIDFEEKMLWACVLRRAVFDHVLYRGVGKHKMRWQRAHRFIFGSGDELVDNLNFEQVCGLFGWEPDYFRRKVKELERGDIKKLEASTFRDCFDEGTAAILTESAKWESGQTVPIFAPYNYNGDFRERMRLREIAPRVPLKRPKSIVPVSSWALATA